MAKSRKKETPCDRGEHKMFATLGGDELCALGCGKREVGTADLKRDGIDKRARLAAARSGNDAELLALLEEGSHEEV